MLKDVKVGDKVWSVMHGWGVVLLISTGEFPIIVNFKNRVELFTSEGKMFKRDMYPVLFFDEVKFEIPKKPLPDLPIDTKVLVWSKESKKYKRHFKEFTKEGRIVCFRNGATSWTFKGEAISWNNWELAE